VGAHIAAMAPTEDHRPIRSSWPFAADIARCLDERLHECLVDAEADPFAFRARLYGILIDDHDAVRRGAGGFRHQFLADAGSVYELIEGPAGPLARVFDAAAVVTTGWAAPSEPGGFAHTAPSRHPERRRVRVLVVVDDEGVGSVLRFGDDPDEPIVEAGGEGRLAEAIDGLWAGVIPTRGS
jgi:hypothetical protein